MKTVKLAIQDFAVPSPRRGSLEPGRGYSPNLQKGIELHQWVQKKRKQQDPNYTAEKKISHTFEHDGWFIKVEGRMDGFCAGVLPRIEEIKSTSSLEELYQSLKRDPFNHPYGLQLMTYGYLYWLQSEVQPELTFHLISVQDRRTRDLMLEFDLSKYEAWLQHRLQELSEEMERALKRSARRKKLVKKLVFPFNKPRAGQMELIETLQNGMQEGQRLMIQAPTGLGKTIGVLWPNLQEALGRGQKVIYVTPKNSQQLVAEEAIEKIQEKGCKVKSLTLTAKSKICMKTEAICDPALCEYAKDYYDKLNAHHLVDELRQKRKLTARTFKKLAEEFKVCPFELQLEAVEEADAIICDYNHVLSERSSLGKVRTLDLAQTGKPNLVIDEAHNLPARAMDQYSPEISCEVLESLKKELPREGASLTSQCQELIKSFSTGNKSVVQPQLTPFIALQEVLREYISRLLEKGEEAQAALHLLFLWSEFCDILPFAVEGRAEFFVTHHPGSFGGKLKITCCDASVLIKAKYENFEHVVAFSATLKPFDYYARLTGLAGENLQTAEFASPYEKKNRKILLIPQISTKWSERDRNYGRVAETISRVIALRPGNYLAFFPSFDFMAKTAPLIKLPEEVLLRQQERQMKKTDVEASTTRTAVGHL